MFVITDLQNNILDFNTKLTYVAYNSVADCFYTTDEIENAAAVKAKEKLYQLSDVIIKNDNDCLDRLKQFKQEENKKCLNSYLKDNFLVWKDNKEYGVTEEDQRELGAEITRYYHAQSVNKNYAPIWHSKGKVSTEWTIEDLTQLEIDIAEYVKPLYLEMQKKKELINNCKTDEDLLHI